jgi:hypothetical protein
VPVGEFLLLPLGLEALEFLLDVVLDGRETDDFDGLLLPDARSRECRCRSVTVAVR